MTLVQRRSTLRWLQMDILASPLTWLMTIVVVLGGVWACAQVAGPLAARPERSSALWLASGVAVSAALGAMALVPTSSNPVGGPVIALLILGILLTVAAFAFLSALLGYAVLARRLAGSMALVGVLAGPLVLGGTALLAVTWSRELQVDQRRDAALERGAGVHIEAQDVRVSTAVHRDPASGQDIEVVETVHLTMAVYFDDPSRRLRGGGIGLGILVALRPPGGGSVLWADPSAWPTRHAAGSDLRFPVAFTLDRSSALTADELRALGRSGTWSLELQFSDDLGGECLATVPVEIAFDA